MQTNCPQKTIENNPHFPLFMIQKYMGIGVPTNDLN
jgi:hypothetical protein